MNKNVFYNINFTNCGGKISHEQALKKAHEEYDQYMQKHLTTAEQDYLEMLNKEEKEIDR